MPFAIRLKELREERGVLQKDVAAFVNLSVRTYCSYELGEREPSLTTLAKLCEYFDVSADYLIGRSDNH